jgi:hypothetical protein
MSNHRGWRDRLGAHSGRNSEPVFEPSDDPTLVAFARVFADSELISLDADKRLRTDALSPLYDCETESVRTAGEAPELFVVIWTPVWSGTEPVAGFRTGHDSAYLGSTVTVAMPQDERTAALLLLVTSGFIHLSGAYDGSGLVIRGAFDDGDDRYRFLELAGGSVPASDSAAVSEEASDAPS